MDFKKRIETLYRLDELIRRKATGNYQDLARRLQISPATLYRYLEDLKSLGAPVLYDRNRKLFYYQEDFNLSHNIFSSQHAKQKNI